MTPMLAFQQHRARAKYRGIPFEMTFEEWWDIWRDWYHLRGRGKNGLCMGRLGDTGPYKVGNVYLTTNLGNLLDRKKRQVSDDERIEKQHKKAILRDKKMDRGELISHLAYKTHCNPEKFVPE